jgi:hypothetical protein
MSVLPYDTKVAAEFMRRLRHQCGLAVSHVRVCENKGIHCRTGTLIQRAIKSTVGDLKGLGYGREANMIIEDTRHSIDLDTRGSQAQD